MAFDRQNDKNKKKRVDQAAALLTLAKESGAAAGPCLSDEQLAAMIDGRIGDGLQQQFREHLSGCGRCYEVWLLLGGLKKRGVTRGRLVRLSTLRRFSYIGSALAAAASVVVYLNISRFEEPAGDLGLPESIVGQRLNKAATPALPAAKEDKAVVGPKREAAKAPMVAFQGSSVSEAPREIDESTPWLAQINEACQAGRQELEFWADIRERGEKVLARCSALPKTPESGKIEAVLHLLQSIESSDSAARQCRLIQDELAKDGRSR